jgi:hypothetical protein
MWYFLKLILCITLEFCLSLYSMRMILPLFLYFIADFWFYLSEKKCIKSQEYASEHGLPKLEHVLLPKTKGFICCLQELRSSLDEGEHPSPLLVPCMHDTFACLLPWCCVALLLKDFFSLASQQNLYEHITVNLQQKIQLLGIISYIHYINFNCEKYTLNLCQTVILWSMLQAFLEPMKLSVEKSSLSVKIVILFSWVCYNHS